MKVKDIETKLQKAITLGHLYFEQEYIAYEIEAIHSNIEDICLRRLHSAIFYISPHAIIEYLTQKEKGNALMYRQVEPLQRMIEKAFEYERTFELKRTKEFDKRCSVSYLNTNFGIWGIISRCNNGESKKEILHYEITMSSEFERALFEVFGKPKTNVLRDMINCKKMNYEYRNSLQRYLTNQHQTTKCEKEQRDTTK